jgi:hypothetical protein
MKPLIFLLALAACAGGVSEEASDREDAEVDGKGTSPPDASSVSRWQDSAVATFQCPSYRPPSARDSGATQCAVATEFCASNAVNRTCQPYGDVCHSCECVLKALQDPDALDAYVPFDFAPPTPGANGCFGDAATGVTLYLSE